MQMSRVNREKCYGASARTSGREPLVSFFRAPKESRQKNKTKTGIMTGYMRDASKEASGNTRLRKMQRNFPIKLGQPPRRIGLLSILIPLSNSLH